MTPFWFFLIAAAVLLALEMVVFQFTTFWLFFVGLGALVAASFAFVTSGSGYLGPTAVFVVASVVITALLYLPIKRWQSRPSSMQDNDALGHRVRVTATISPTSPGTVFWSGSEWQAELVEGSSLIIEKEQWARVVRVEGIRLLVEADTA
ncbi:hypothetical protein AB833_19070 [Chromatiales bacterium (ex Bugula neritina AB1)]|nr:hypothetical protein AB833_19070 [Chromatiales bacterium (ex Bugula neritina AB1)]